MRVPRGKRRETAKLLTTDRAVLLRVRDTSGIEPTAEAIGNIGSRNIHTNGRTGALRIARDRGNAGNDPVALNTLVFLSEI